MTVLLTHDENAALAQMFETALAFDRRSEAVNSAKLKSVAQHQQWEQFKNMVAGAELKPVDFAAQPLDAIAARRPQGTDATQSQSSLPLTLGVTGPSLSVADKVSRARDEARMAELLRSAKSQLTLHTQPKTPHDLTRDWRRLTVTTDRFHYLLSLDAPSLPRLMKGGAGMEIFGSIVDTVDQSLSLLSFSNSAQLLDLFAAFSRVDRFSLTLAFLTASEKLALQRLFDQLQITRTSSNDTKNEYEVTELRQKYNV